MVRLEFSMLLLVVACSSEVSPPSDTDASSSSMPSTSSGETSSGTGSSDSTASDTLAEGDGSATSDSTSSGTSSNSSSSPTSGPGPFGECEPGCEDDSVCLESHYCDGVYTCVPDRARCDAQTPCEPGMFCLDSALDEIEGFCVALDFLDGACEGTCWQQCPMGS